MPSGYHTGIVFQHRAPVVVVGTEEEAEDFRRYLERVVAGRNDSVWPRYPMTEMERVIAVSAESTPTDLCKVAVDELTDILSGAKSGDPYATLMGYMEAFAEARDRKLATEAWTAPARNVVVRDEAPPARIIFLPNGLAAVFDQRGQQIPKYQEGNHQEVIARLEADGYDWQKLEATGTPQTRFTFRGQEIVMTNDGRGE